MNPHAFIINKIFRRSRHTSHSCSELLQVACNADPVEKSTNPKDDTTAAYITVYVILLYLLVFVLVFALPYF